VIIVAVALAGSLVHAWLRNRRAAAAPAPPVAAQQPPRPPAAAPLATKEPRPAAAAPLATKEPGPAAAPVAGQQPQPRAAAPVATTQPPQPPAAENDPPVQQDRALSATVLLVDDEDDVRGSTVRILERAGFEVLEARSAADALDVWHGHDAPIDLLLSDVVMPGASGVELAAEIEALSPGTAIILISGFTPSALAHHRLVSGDDGALQLLHKPLTPAELVAAVRKTIVAARAQAA
jgi:CheY-like chemotaxis protein